MKRGFFIFLAVLLLLFPAKVFSGENWSIEKFHSQIRTLEDGNVNITETIAVDFDGLTKHGIYRDIPYIYQSEGGEKTATKITVKTVTRNNTPVPYKVSKSGNFIQVKIGDPKKTVSGKQEYEITYLASGILRPFGDHDELYWNVTGNAWAVPINESSAQVSLPAPGIIRIACYQGRFGSTSSCQAERINPQEAFFQSRGSFGPGEGLTVVVGYPKNLVPIITITPPKTLEKDLLTLLNLTIFILTFLAGVATLFWLWWKLGRDFWWRRRYPFDPEMQAEIKPVGAYEPVVVEYEPPENLRPAEIGTLIDERADTLDVSATIIDLAARGFFTITEVPKTWLFGKTDYILKKTNKDSRGLLDYEKELLERLFEEGDVVIVSTLKTKFYDDLKIVKKKLYQEVVAKKFFLENPEKVRERYQMIGVIAGFAGVIFVSIGIWQILGFLAALGTGLLLNGLLLFLFAKIMPRRTVHGYETYWRALGYRLFVSKVEKYKQQFLEKKNIFNEVLPYVIVFGLTEKFAKALKGLGIKPPQPTWYIGIGVFDPGIFGSRMASFSNSVSSAIAATPHSGFAGGSSFGGGFSGGGFGGGGGGSW